MKDLTSTKPTVIIGGPTSSGKTNLALKIATKIPADIVSADSRQVYKDLSIIPGKDIPKGFKKIKKHQATTYTNNQFNIYGHDLIDINQDWSIAHFYKFTQNLLPKIWSQARLPIIVGGTGFYLKSIYNPPSSLTTPPNPKLRHKLNNFSTEDLHQELNKLDPKKLKSLNQSDRQNKRRLIRAIEVATNQAKPPLPLSANTLAIWVRTNTNQLEINIRNRVQERLKRNWKQELKLLLKHTPDWNLAPYNTIGYQELTLFQKKELSQEELIELWTTKELQYAKRQITWFKKQNDFQELSPNQVVDAVLTWYHEAK